MSFNASYIINDKIKNEDENLNAKMKDLLILQEQIAIANGFDVVGSYPLTQEYKKITELKAFYPMQERVGSIAKDYASNPIDGEYSGVIVGSKPLSEKITSSVELGYRAWMKAPVKASVGGLGSYTFTFVADLSVSTPEQNIWFEPIDTNLQKARLQILWNGSGYPGKLLILSRTGNESQIGQLETTTEAIPPGYAVYHITVDVATSAVKIYRNGTRIQGTENTNYGGATVIKNTSSTVGAYLGRAANAPGGYFYSNVAYVALFSRVLTTTEMLRQSKAAGFIN